MKRGENLRMIFVPFWVNSLGQDTNDKLQEQNKALVPPCSFY